MKRLADLIFKQLRIKLRLSCKLFYINPCTVMDLTFKNWLLKAT